MSLGFKLSQFDGVQGQVDAGGSRQGDCRS